MPRKRLWGEFSRTSRSVVVLIADGSRCESAVRSADRWYPIRQKGGLALPPPCYGDSHAPWSASCANPDCLTTGGGKRFTYSKPSDATRKLAVQPFPSCSKHPRRLPNEPNPA